MFQRVLEYTNILDQTISAPIFSSSFQFQGEYRQSGAMIHVPPAKLPIWMLSGKYSAKAELWDEKAHLGCLKLNIKLE